MKDKTGNQLDGGGVKPYVVPDFTMPGDEYVREVIGFYEIITQISFDNTDIVEQWFMRNAPLMSEDARSGLSAVLGEVGEAMGKAAERAEQIREGVASGEDFGPIRINVPNRELTDVFGNILNDLFHRALIDRVTLVGRAFLIAAVSSFEVLFAQVARLICQRNPSALSKSEYVFTLEELSQYSSIEEAREALITRRVEGLLMESVDGWSKWLERTVNFTFPEIITDWQNIREVFARRNILVHAGGKVSKRYLQELSNSSIDVGDLAIGQKLEVPRTYLEDALERLAALGILLMFRAWSRLYKSDLDDGCMWVKGNQDYLIRLQMWTAAQLISEQFGSIGCRRDIALAFQVNGWLARKRSQGIESIRPEVTEWDVTGLAPKYDMTKSLLLDQVEVAHPKVDKEVQSGRLSSFEIATNPLFAEYREHVSQLQQSPSPQPEISTDQDSGETTAD